MYGARHGLEGLLTNDLIDLTQETPETLERVARTPSAALGSVRKKASEEDCKKLIKVFKENDIRYFFYIGGNDTAETANIVDELARGEDYEFRVCHIPKTIDHDLREMRMEIRVVLIKTPGGCSCGTRPDHTLSDLR